MPVVTDIYPIKLRTGSAGLPRTLEFQMATWFGTHWKSLSTDNLDIQNYIIYIMGL